jgi:hypothetical protein
VWLAPPRGDRLAPSPRSTADGTVPREARTGTSRAPDLEDDMTVLDTATTPAAAAPEPPRAAPGTGARRRAAAVSAVGAGLLTFAGFVTTPWEGEQDTAKYLQALADNEVQGQVAATFLHFGFLLMVPALLALGRMVRHRATRLGNVGLGIGLFGAIGLPGLLVVDFYGLELGKQLPIEQAVAIEEAAHGHGLATLMTAPSGMGMFLGLLLLLVAAARARQLSWWLVPLVPAGVVVSATPALLQATIGSALLALVFVVVGVRTWQMSDLDWERGPQA